ncbi:hypothetical protein N7513_008516 [Penicillium frequentans]|nr:hypothetical protein N7513_008516 [Penicillium glabrum]
MPPERRPKIFAYADFDLRALCSLASALRRGIPCACDRDQLPVSGSYHWVVFISFADQVRWVFRSPLMKESMPVEMRAKIIASEVATLRCVRTYSNIPVPEVYYHCVSSNNTIGVPFILMSEASGRPLSKFWRATSSRDGLDIRTKSKILHQLGRITWKLSQLRFDKIGSLFEEHGSINIGECLSRGHMSHQRYRLDIPRGPFTSEAEFYDSVIEAFSQHAELLPLKTHCFVAPVPMRKEFKSEEQFTWAEKLWIDFMLVGRKIDTADNRLDYMIAAEALRDILGKLELPTVIATFPLFHPDLSINNIFVDNDYNITCVIDWTFASSVPESMLLAYPGLPQQRNELSPELYAPFHSGFIAAMPAASIENTLIHRYSESFERSKTSWDLIRLLNMDLPQDYIVFAKLWKSAYGSKKNLQRYFLQRQRSPHYAWLHRQVKKEDDPQSKVQKKEDVYFGRKFWKHTIARKLTLVSEFKARYADNSEPRLRNDMFVTSPSYGGGLKTLCLIG